jgi:hypothetical protein
MCRRRSESVQWHSRVQNGEAFRTSKTTVVLNPRVGPPEAAWLVFMLHEGYATRSGSHDRVAAGAGARAEIVARTAVVEAALTTARSEAATVTASTTAATVAATEVVAAIIATETTLDVAAIITAVIAAEISTFITAEVAAVIAAIVTANVTATEITALFTAIVATAEIAAIINSTNDVTAIINTDVTIDITAIVAADVATAEVPTIFTAVINPTEVAAVIAAVIATEVTAIVTTAEVTAIVTGAEVTAIIAEVATTAAAAIVEFAAWAAARVGAVVVASLALAALRVRHLELDGAAQHFAARVLGDEVFRRDAAGVAEEGEAWRVTRNPDVGHVRIVIRVEYRSDVLMARIARHVAHEDADASLGDGGRVVVVVGASLVDRRGRLRRGGRRLRGRLVARGGLIASRLWRRAAAGAAAHTGRLALRVAWVCFTGQKQTRKRFKRKTQ